MVNYLRAEGLGMKDDSAILRTSDKKLLKIQAGDHLGDISSIYHNEPNDLGQFLLNVRDMGKRRIAREYIGKNISQPEIIRSLFSETSTVELDDKSRKENLLTPCILPSTVVYDGEIVIDEDLLTSEENFKKAQEKVDKLSQELSDVISRPIESTDMNNFVKVVKIKHLNNLLSKGLSDTYSDFKSTRDDTQFIRLEDIKYSKRGEAHKIDENEYSKLKVSAFGVKGVITPFTILPSSFAVLKGKENDRMYTVPVNGERALENVCKNIEENELLNGVLDFSREVNLRDCCDFIPFLLDKNAIDVENVYSVATVEENEPIVIGDKLRLIELKPKKSFATLYNGLEKRTVAVPTHIGVSLNLSMSDSLNVKIEDPVEIPIS